MSGPVGSDPAAPPFGANSVPPNRLSASIGCFVVILLPTLLVALISGAMTVALSNEKDPQVSQRAIVTAVETRLDDGRERPCYTVEFRVEGELKVHQSCDVNAGIRPGPAKDLRPDETKVEEEQRFRSTHPVGSQVKVLRDQAPPYEARGAIADTDLSISGGDPMMAKIAALIFLFSSGLAIILVLIPVLKWWRR